MPIPSLDMPLSDLAALLTEAAEALAVQTAAQATNLLLVPGSTFSLVALAATCAVAAWCVVRGRARNLPARVLLRALFPRRIWRSRSGRADIFYTAFNTLFAPVIFAWAVFSSTQVAEAAAALLVAPGGAGLVGSVPWLVSAPLVTVLLYLAYEFGYWVHHYLSHKWPLLWPFHRIHHTADSLSLMTAFRVHPVDTIAFYNIVALFVGLAAASAQGLFGDVTPLAIGGNNLLLFTASVLVTHLHHSHLPLRFTGLAGWWLLSPGHHQVHHSDRQDHYDRNFGNSLTLFDRLFGTLCDPEPAGARLRFGAGPLDHDPHSLAGGLLAPFADAARGAVPAPPASPAAR